MSNQKTFGLGLIGCGGFGRFCLEAFSTLPQVRIVSAAEHMPDTAEIARRQFGIPVYMHSYELIARPDVDIVHIATPPASHRDLVMQCCVAHKNVLCEKPLAMSLAQADEMLEAAAKINVICPVNFVLRYNEVTHTVKRILDSHVLGQPLAARLTNCATDAKLPQGHWFWDRETSGGIFIEHGVHFFDLYRYWFGEGEVLYAATMTRPRTHQEDRVTCLVRHENGMLADHYHAFDQMFAMDRTDHRILTELGELTVEGWIPLTIRIDAAVDEAALDQLRAMCPGAQFDVMNEFSTNVRALPGRGRERTADRRVRMTYTPHEDKQSVYAQSVRELLVDQLSYLEDCQHARIVVESNGREAVALAERAAMLANVAAREFTSSEPKRRASA